MNEVRISITSDIIDCVKNGKTKLGLIDSPVTLKIRNELGSNNVADFQITDAAIKNGCLYLLGKNITPLLMTRLSLAYRYRDPEEDVIVETGTLDLVGLAVGETYQYVIDIPFTKPMEIIISGNPPSFMLVHFPTLKSEDK